MKRVTISAEYVIPGSKKGIKKTIGPVLASEATNIVSSLIQKRNCVAATVDEVPDDERETVEQLRDQLLETQALANRVQGVLDDERTLINRALAAAVKVDCKEVLEVFAAREPAPEQVPDAPEL